ncbi:hypothetical protein L226DRAFT_131226 [Lentinus tigrinus ALCF2SS1-7]|uniref:uncharacterized protein n=1 Tax=Lentinus tigrinus ALCF2SS1-7 TaxID=1328758 RepID=UPI0011660411|nr:hypothetical protein L226DRAFT_131226 [Lentinus tigrinus ALCF2SS1-7]
MYAQQARTIYLCMPVTDPEGENIREWQESHTLSPASLQLFPADSVKMPRPRRVARMPHRTSIKPKIA